MAATVGVDSGRHLVIATTTRQRTIQARLADHPPTACRSRRAWSLLPPVVGAGIYWAQTKSWSRMSAAVLAFNLLSAVLAVVGSHDSKILLYKDCFATTLIGLIFLVSLFFRRPLVFWFGQRFATDGTPQGLEWWDSLWQFKQFRDSQRQTTLVWAAVMMIEAIAKAWVITSSSFTTAYMWDQILPLVATGIGIAGTMWLAARAAAAGKKARAERLAGQPFGDHDPQES